MHYSSYIPQNSEVYVTDNYCAATSYYVVHIKPCSYKLKAVASRNSYTTNFGDVIQNISRVMYNLVKII